MSFAGDNQFRQPGAGQPGSESAVTLVIGYGNRQRRDDGIGPFIVERLRRLLHVSDTFRFLTVPKLTGEMLEELSSAGLLLFVDTTVEGLENGWRCERIAPEKSLAGYQTHCLTPPILLGLLGSLYRKTPPAWMVSVQGDDFRFGDEISPVARKRVEKAFSDIVETVLRIHEGER